MIRKLGFLMAGTVVLIGCVAATLLYLDGLTWLNMAAMGCLAPVAIVAQAQLAVMVFAEC